MAMQYDVKSFHASASALAYDGRVRLKGVITSPTTSTVFNTAVLDAGGPSSVRPYTKADIRMEDDVVVMVDAGAPTNGTTGDNFAGTGSLYVDSTAGKLYINTGAISNPTWVVVGTQT